MSRRHGRPALVYHVNQRDSYVVVASYPQGSRPRLVDRWQELERKAAEFTAESGPTE